MATMSVQPVKTISIMPLPRHEGRTHLLSLAVEQQEILFVAGGGGGVHVASGHDAGEDRGEHHRTAGKERSTRRGGVVGGRWRGASRGRYGCGGPGQRGPAEESEWWPSRRGWGW